MVPGIIFIPTVLVSFLISSVFVHNFLEYKKAFLLLSVTLAVYV